MNVGGGEVVKPGLSPVLEPELLQPLPGVCQLCGAFLGWAQVGEFTPQPLAKAAYLGSPLPRKLSACLMP